GALAVVGRSERGSTEARARRAGAASYEVALASLRRKEVLGHAAQERVIEPMVGRVAEHRIDAAARAQRGLLGVDPHLDLGVGERAEAEEAGAARARLDLRAVARRVLVGRDAQLGIDHVPT